MIIDEDRMVKFFEYSHLPPHLQEVSKLFYALVKELIFHLESGPERTVAFRKLLEAKDAAVRAALHKGG